VRADDTEGSTVVSVAVVTGGAVGIGAAIAEELGRQGSFVVTVDPGVNVDGTPSEGGAEATTAQRIVDAGGKARASNISVTDVDAVRTLFADLVEEFGTVDVVVNAAGIVRPSGFANGDEDAWRSVLSVHLDGYLNVLGAALPLMAAAGGGRVLGVTSGSGWRAADAGGYSCAKRAVAALTWGIGRETPPGVSVNALSPIAATRMVLGAQSRQAGAADRSEREAAAGGLSLGSAAMRPPEHLGPVGAYLVSEAFSAWARGEIMFSNGAELAWIVPPRLLEVVRTGDVGSLPSVLDAFGSSVLAPVEAAQTSNGGGNPRLGTAFEESSAEGRSRNASRAVVVSDVPAWTSELCDALAKRGVTCVTIDHPATNFAGASEQLAGTSGNAVDSVVLALSGGDVAVSSDAPSWQRVLDEHAGIADRIGTDAAWVRAVADLSARSEARLRVVTLVDASNAGGRSRAQAAAQLSRGAHGGTEARVDALSLSIEAQDRGGQSLGEIVSHLACNADAGSLSGAELVVGANWFGLRSHPHPAGAISFGGPELPTWLDDSLREMASR
jgi:NAD(P)-dependent dehydrogenase (short-subunit alcohol dehydrogenase family)